MSFADELEELESAEDFLNYFAIDFAAAVVHVNRLHILQRYHDYLRQAEIIMPAEEDAQKAVYKQLLQRALQDFVVSDAQTEKVFKVFKMAEPQQVFIGLDQIRT